MSTSRIIHGDCRDVLPTLSLDGCVVITDPPWPESTVDIQGTAAAALPLWLDVAPLLTTARAVVIVQSSLGAPLPGPPMPFYQVCWLRSIPPGYRGTRMLNHVAYVYGAPPRPPGKTLHAGESMSSSPESQARRRASDHPCPFSLDHARWLVRWFAGQLEVVDPFCGSGVFLQAASELGLPSTGIDIDERWIADAERNVRGAEKQLLLGGCR